MNNFRPLVRDIFFSLIWRRISIVGSIKQIRHLWVFFFAFHQYSIPVTWWLKLMENWTRKRKKLELVYIQWCSTLHANGQLVIEIIVLKRMYRCTNDLLIASFVFNIFQSREKQANEEKREQQRENKVKCTTFVLIYWLCI